MPIIKSAKKRVKTANKAAIRNSKTKRTLRTAIKSFRAGVSTKKVTAESHAEAQSALDIAVKKGIIHKNKAARQKAQLAKAAKAAGGTKPGVGVKKAAAPKVAAKAPVAKKTPAKKPAAAKAPAKKPAAKKAAPKK
jgi:small subunit ribosomal protein S20